MATRACDDGIETGVATLDAEHRLQVGLVRALEELIRQGTDLALADRTMAQIAEFAQVHFQSEELIMGLYGDPHQAAHRAEHALLTARIRELQRRVSGREPEQALEVSGALHRALTEHIRTLDRTFARWCTEKGIEVR